MDIKEIERHNNIDKEARLLTEAEYKRLGKEYKPNIYTQLRVKICPACNNNYMFPNGEKVGEWLYKHRCWKCNHKELYYGSYPYREEVW